MSSSVSHKGIITSISEKSITVSITPTASECNGCAISAMCGKGSSIEVPIENNSENYSIGDLVTIWAPMTMKRNATLIMLVIPLIIVIGVLILALYSGLNDSISAIISLISLIVWYTIIYIIRPRMRNKIEFKLKH